MKATPSNADSIVDSNAIWVRYEINQSVGHVTYCEFLFFNGDLGLNWQSLAPVHQLDQNLIQNCAANQLLFRELI